MAKKYYVASGKSILTKAGIKNAGEEITAKMLTGGDEAFQKLINSKKQVVTTSEPEKVEEPAKVEEVKEEKPADEKSEKKDGGATKK